MSFRISGSLREKIAQILRYYREVVLEPALALTIFTSNGLTDGARPDRMLHSVFVPSVPPVPAVPGVKKTNQVQLSGGSSE